MKNNIKIFAVAAFLLAAILACSLPFGGGAEADPTPTVAYAEAESLVEAWDQAVQIGKDTGSFTLTLTEEQMTAFLGVSLANKPELPLTNPRIELRDGEMEVVGTYTTNSISAEVSVVMQVTIDEAGKPVIEVTSGSIGLLPVPVELLTGISEAVNQALTGQVGTTATGFTLEQITITEGEISLTGMLK